MISATIAATSPWDIVEIRRRLEKLRSAPRDASLSPDFPADAVEVFRVRADIRSYLVRQFEMELHEAVDELWAAGVRTGVISRLGVDGAQAILSEAFKWLLA